MSAIINTKKALERKLKQTLGTLKIAFEGVSFTPPTDQAYVRVQIVPQSPDDPVIGDLYYRERITLQVFVADSSGKGTTPALQIAEQIRAAFHKGFTTTESGYNIYILDTPQIAGTSVSNDRVIVPVLIQVVTEVFS